MVAFLGGTLFAAHTCFMFAAFGTFMTTFLGGTFFAAHSCFMFAALGSVMVAFLSGIMAAALCTFMATALCAAFFHALLDFLHQGRQTCVNHIVDTI